MFDWRKLNWKHLFTVLLILHLLPIWIFGYFPSQDGASHVYNALVLKEYNQHENFKMRDAWKLNIIIFPNWLSHISLAALLYVFPPVIAEKVFLTFAIGMIPVSFFYFLNAVHRGKQGRYLFAWLGFPFAYNYLLYMGFYNFTLSVAFFFFSFGFWWKHKDYMEIKHLCILYVLLLLTYLSHIVSYGLVVLAMSIAAACIWGSETLVETWRIHKRPGNVNVSDLFNQFKLTIKPFFYFLLYMIPIYFVLMEYYLQSIKRHQEGNHRGMEWISDYFWGVKSIAYFTDWNIPINHFLLVILGSAILISIGYRIYRKQKIEKTDAFLAIAIVFTYMFIKAPWGYGPGGWINDRIHLYILLMLAPWLIIDMHKYLRHTLTTLLVIFTLAHCVLTAFHHGQISGEIAELVSGAKMIKPHSTFTHRSAGWHKSEHLYGHYDKTEKKIVMRNDIKYVKPFLHSTAFYGVYADDVVHMANYEANYYYFPVNRNNQDSVALDYIRADYVIAWFYPETELFADLIPNYDIIHETKNLKLFQRKTTKESNTSIWNQTEEGHLIIRFDMQADAHEVQDNFHIVAPKTMYIDGRYGWDTEWNPRDLLNKGNWRISPRQTFLGHESQPPLVRDGVFGTEDAAFRLDLPNGTYRITNIFQTPESATHEVNMLANGKQIIKKLIVPMHNERVEEVDTVDVDNGYLILVIYTSKKRIKTDTKPSHWVWNGCIVEQIATREE